MSHYSGQAMSVHLLWRRRLWPKLFSLAKTSYKKKHCFSKESCSASACLLQFKTPFFPFLPIPTSWNKSSVSVCSWDSHAPCQETCEPGNAFIFEEMCLCRKPTPIGVTLTQVHSNELKLRGGMSWKGFLGYIGKGLRPQFCLRSILKPSPKSFMFSKP